MSNLGPTPLIRQIELATAASGRKLRLYACACCRTIGRLMSDQRSHQAVRVAERFADGQATLTTLREAHWQATQALKLLDVQEGARVLTPLAGDRDRALDAAHHAARAAWRTSTPELLDGQAASIVALNASQAARHADRPITDLDELFRDLFGAPLPPPELDPAWLRWNDGTIPRIAQAIYDQRRFRDVPILADALEEAGCTNGDTLEHCRGPGPHVRGCWVVDRLLGKV